MINGKRIAVVMPTYNAEKTLERTVGELSNLVDIRILVDDHSSDCTVELAQRLGLAVFVHDRNYGYGRQAGLFLLWCGERLRRAWLVFWDKNWAS